MKTFCLQKHWVKQTDGTLGLEERFSEYTPPKLNAYCALCSNLRDDKTCNPASAQELKIPPYTPEDPYLHIECYFYEQKEVITE